MNVATRPSPTKGRKVTSTVRPRRSKRLAAALVGVVIAAAAALGVLRDAGGGAAPEPPPATVIADPDGTPVMPFPPVPPATGDGVSSVDG